MADQKLLVVRDKFVSGVNKAVLAQVVDDLLREGVLNDGEADAVKESGQKQEQARVLVDHARQKGPRASQAFIRSLCARDAFLAEALGLPDTPPPGRPEPQRGAEANAACVPESRTGMTLCPPDQCREIQAKEAGKIYPIGDRRSRTRLALIICNITFAHLNKREGAEVDLRGMTLLLEDLGYRVEIKINLTAKEMSTCLKDFAAREEHKTSDSTFLVLMSHGVRDGLCGVQSRDKDSDVLPIDDVFSIFNNNNCRALYEKPKVVIIQACRGTNKGVTYVSDSVVPVVPSADSASSSANYEEDAVRMVHLESDFICLYSTTLNTVSWRSPQLGSVFIVELIKQLKEHAWNCDLEEIFRKVQEAFANNRPLQMPSRDRTTLIRKFYLFPGN
ncbi:caspase-1 [Anolis carolinensis]|uniref:caspase-1 n=1 Tax=Anolis carolinensis TaxID=28377 RepID=UPI002F2B2D2D